ncbi:MAG: ketopantoate reductase family protein [Endomicrobiia bacterium]
MILSKNIIKKSSNNNRIKTVIIGPGAIGCLFASHLSKLPHIDLWILDKNLKRAKYLQKTGIKVKGLSKIYLKPEKIKITTKPEKIGKADLIIVCVKSHQTEKAIKKAIPCISKNTTILTIQNGLNNIKTIEKVTKRKTNIIAGITSHGATLLSPGKINHAGKGPTIIGRTDKKTNIKDLIKIKRIFNEANIETKIKNDIQSVLWSKLILNSAINPVGSISFRKNGEIIKDEFLKDILCKTAEESAEVAKKLGIKLIYKNPSRKVIDVCKKTSQNYNSMLQDIMHHKKTEIEYINGAIIRKAKEIGLETPYNNMLYYFVKFLEENYPKWNKKKSTK